MVSSFLSYYGNFFCCKEQLYKNKIAQSGPFEKLAKKVPKSGQLTDRQSQTYWGFCNELQSSHSQIRLGHKQFSLTYSSVLNPLSNAMASLGFLRIPTNALSMTILQWTRVLPFMITARTIMGTVSNQQSQRIQHISSPVVNVWSRLKMFDPNHVKLIK